ncbi:MAG: hypothetical protein KAH54_05350 [Candidatus Sabulitectum sp.]|nr:hypothetical protein [Candidatus Sabulitectum sp.]
MNNRAVRILLPLAVIAGLAFFGVIDLSILPMEDPNFQVTLATIGIYMIWSVLESSTETNSSRITLYAVLLVSALDTFLLELTNFPGLMFLRWTGVFLLTSGCIARLLALRSENTKFLRYGRIGQELGIALGLGSVAGTVVAIFPGIPSSLKEND